MKTSTQLLLAAAALVAAAGGASAWILLPGTPSAAAVAVSAPPAIVVHCKQAAELLYEVNWAAACFKNNDENDCTLPDAQAAKVNSILATEEARCMAAEAYASARQ